MQQAWGVPMLSARSQVPTQEPVVHFNPLLPYKPFVFLQTPGMQTLRGYEDCPSPLSPKATGGPAKWQWPGLPVCVFPPRATLSELRRVFQNRPQ